MMDGVDAFNYLSHCDVVNDDDNFGHSDEDFDDDNNDVETNDYKGKMMIVSLLLMIITMIMMFC